MKRFSWALFAVGMLAANVHGVVLLEDNVDGYADQAAFESAWTPIGCGAASTTCSPPSPLPSNTLSMDTAVSGTTSLLNHSPVGSPLSADSAQRNQRTFTDSPALAPGDQLVFSFDFYDLDAAVAPFRQYANLQDTTAPTLNNQLVSMGLNNNLGSSAQDGNYYMARILGGLSNGGTASAYFKLNDAGAPLRSTGWHNLRVAISSDNGTSTDYAFYVDNILSETVLNVGTAIRQYDTIRVGAGVSSTTDAYFDNFLVEFIPAPVVIINADFNGNLEIDAADYAVWRDNNPTASGATRSTGDSDSDGDVDDNDYANWKATFGNAAPPGSGAVLGAAAAVPEPATILLLLAATGLFAAGRRR